MYILYNEPRKGKYSLISYIFRLIKNNISEVLGCLLFMDSCWALAEQSVKAGGKVNSAAPLKVWLSYLF